MKNLFKFYIYSNLHVSLAVFCLLQVSGFLFNINVNIESVLAFCGTFIFYHATRFLNWRKKEEEHKMFAWSQSHQKKLYGLVAIFGVIVLIAIWRLSLYQFIVLTVCGIFTVIYALPIYKFKHQKISLRFVPGFKIFLIGLVWSSVTVFLPLVDKSVPLHELLVYFLQILLLIIAITIPFDIRDIAFDHKDLKTIPQVLGIKKSKWLAAVLLWISLWLQVYIWGIEHLLVYGIIVLLSILWIFRVNRKTSEYLVSFWIEGIPIFWWSLLYLKAVMT